MPDPSITDSCAPACPASLPATPQTEGEGREGRGSPRIEWVSELSHEPGSLGHSNAVALNEAFTESWFNRG